MAVSGGGADSPLFGGDAALEPVGGQSEESGGTPEARVANGHSSQLARVAALTGGRVESDGGSTSVVFAPQLLQPPAPATSGPVIARTVQAAPPARMLARSAVADAAPSAPFDVDELYDRIAARLRRELLDDRERAGDLLGDFPHARIPR